MDRALLQHRSPSDRRASAGQSIRARACRFPDRGRGACWLFAARRFRLHTLPARLCASDVADSRVVDVRPVVWCAPTAPRLAFGSRGACDHRPSSRSRGSSGDPGRGFAEGSTVATLGFPAAREPTAAAALGASAARAASDAPQRLVFLRLFRRGAFRALDDSPPRAAGRGSPRTPGRRTHRRERNPRRRNPAADGAVTPGSSLWSDLPEDLRQAILGSRATRNYPGNIPRKHSLSTGTVAGRPSPAIAWRPRGACSFRAGGCRRRSLRGRKARRRTVAAAPNRPRICQAGTAGAPPPARGRTEGLRRYRERAPAKFTWRLVHRRQNGGGSGSGGAGAGCGGDKEGLYGERQEPGKPAGRLRLTSTRCAALNRQRRGERFPERLRRRVGSPRISGSTTQSGVRRFRSSMRRSCRESSLELPSLGWPDRRSEAWRAVKG